LPHPAFRRHGSELADQLERIGASFRAAQFGALLDPILRYCLERGFAEAGAHEGTVWLLDETGEALEPVYNSGPRAAEFVGKFKQPLHAGLICMVYASEQPFLENEVGRNTHQSKLLDTLLSVQTCAMIAVPLYFLHACRGVISCVQLQRPGEPAGAPPPGFTAEQLEAVQRASALVTQLVDLRLLSRAVGWGSD
jgi:hypothetical protein